MAKITPPSANEKGKKKTVADPLDQTPPKQEHEERVSLQLSMTREQRIEFKKYAASCGMSMNDLFFLMWNEYKKQH